MRTLSEKIRLLLAALVLPATPLLAQEGNAPVPAAASAPAPAAAPSPGATGPGGINDGTATTSALDYFFNHQPGQGTAAKEFMNADDTAKQRAMAQDAMGGTQIEDPAMRAKFERYLGTTEIPADQLKAYATDMQGVIDLLHEGKTMDAWKQLYKLAQYQSIDAGVSWELANRIESIWNANETSQSVANQDDVLRKQASDANYNADVMTDEMRHKDMETQAKENEINKGSSSNSSSSSSSSSTNAESAITGQEGSPTQPPPDALLGKLQLTEQYLDSLQAQATIKLNDLRMQKLFDQVKDDFADYITMLYDTGRYRQVLIAADFWRQIFAQGDYPVSMAKEVTASLEIANEVDNTVQVFNHDIDENNIAAATDRLQQAFMLSQFHPAVLGVPLARKKSVETLSRELSQMESMIDVRDFSDLEPLLAKIKQTAPDFDSIKAMAMVNAVKLESELRLGKAKLDAQQGDLKQAMEEFQAAAEAWPGNPDLKDKALTFFNTEDVQNESLTEFDRLVADNNYRQIFDQQLAFAPAMKDDLKRQAQLKDALEKYKLAETAVEKATLMQSNGDVYGAWEAVTLAAKSLPDDVKLNSMRGDLAGKAAEFVSAINKAQDSEARQDDGYSLTWYAIAQRDYPASSIANEAIPRLSKKILAHATL